MPSHTDNQSAATSAQKELINALRAYLASSRVTLRLHRDGQPTLVAESLAAGVRSMRSGTQEDASQFPTYQHVEQTREVLIQNDLLHHEIRPPVSLIEEYRTHAQMLAPVKVDEDMIGIVSVHQVDTARQWTDDEVEALKATANALALLERLNGSASS